jgi:predicted nucleic acid-binding protein
MTRAVDTTFLVQLELKEAAGHEKARAFLETAVLAPGNPLALTPQVLEEFIHVVTDARRFERPLEMGDALDKADTWWRAAEVRHLFPDSHAVMLFIEWMRGLRLGRMRLHDTLLAATCLSAGIGEIVTSDRQGFEVFAGLAVCDPLTWTEDVRSDARGM